jgi:hypothetical protein
MRTNDMKSGERGVSDISWQRQRRRIVMVRDAKRKKKGWKRGGRIYPGQTDDKKCEQRLAP